MREQSKLSRWQNFFTSSSLSTFFSVICPWCIDSSTLTIFQLWGFKKEPIDFELYLESVIKDLRVRISKNCQMPEKEFSGTICVSYQNQYYLSKCTTNHRNFGAEVKIRVMIAQSSFGFKAKMTKFSPNILTTF